MILTDLRSPLAKCVLCAWFNEWHRFGERDQLSLSYVLHAMDLTPKAEPKHGHWWVAANQHRRHKGVYLWPRHEHWHHKRDKEHGEPKKHKSYVKYVGHGGCADVPPKGHVYTNPGCPGARKPKKNQI